MGQIQIWHFLRYLCLRAIDEAEVSMPEFQPERFGQRDQDTKNVWVVVIEASARSGEAPYSFATVQELVVRLGEWHATGLYCADRYALQLDIRALTSDQALRFAMATHRMAAENLAMGPPLFLRAEVLDMDVLPDEQPEEEQSTSPFVGGNPVSADVYEATRAVLRSGSVDEVRSALVAFVTTIGGSVVPGPQRTGPGMVTADISLEADEQVYASAELMSIAGFLIELSMPTLVEDARRACRRLKRLPEPC
jgi:hypothetical protein